MTYLAPDPKVARYGRRPDGNFGMLDPEPVAETVAPLPENAVADLLSILADPAASKKRLDEIAGKTTELRRVVADAKAARAERAKLDKEIDAIRQAHAEKLANELAAHTVAMKQRERNLEGREAAAEAKRKEADKLLAELKAERAELQQVRENIRKAAA